MTDNKIKTDEGFVELVRCDGNELDVVNSARICTGGESDEVSERDKKLIRYLMRNQHWSCFEHTYMTFRVKCSLPIATQWIRHKSWSPNQVSRRYTNSDITVYTPIEWRKQSTDNKQCSNGIFEGDEHDKITNIYQDVVDNALEAYKTLIEMGVANEQARYILPCGTHTELILTCNLRSLIHFLGLRDHEHAQYEIRQCAVAIRQLVADKFPTIFDELYGEK